MGKTIYEKILTRVSGQKDLKPGDVVWISPDVIAMVDMGWRIRSRIFNDMGLKKLRKPERVVAIMDHCTEQLIMPAGAENNRFFRKWITDNEIKNFYDAGRSGLATQVLAEKGHVLPGIAVIGDDSEWESNGALGAFSKGSEDIMTAMAIDKCWIEIPKVVLCTVKGTFPLGVGAVDLRNKMLGDLGIGYGKFIEFTGPAIDEMGIDDRMNLCSSWHNIGSNAIIAADQRVVDYLGPRTKTSYEIVKSDTDAEYDEILDYDVSTLETQIASPPTAMDVGPISDVEGMAIDQACIGSCANGRMEDLRIAAKILKGRKVHHNVRMYITPISQEVMKQAISEGLLNIFIDAGVMIPIPSCSTCPGHVGQLADDEICVATHTSNYSGRMGSLKAKIYLTSAAAVAASAVEGKMTNPQNYL